MKHFKRPSLAAQMSDQIRGLLPFSDGKNGLFLAANRRTGKSAFLQNDLKPLLESLGITVIYIDLWTDIATDPGTLISAAIQEKIQSNLGVISKLAKKSGIDSIGLAGTLKLDLTKIGKSGGATIATGLAALIAATKKPVALIIDEAQHTLTTTAGVATMKALKAARDTINLNDSINLMLVMTGSDRDKLVRLVNSSSAAFYGSSVQTMPTLAADFIEFVAQAIEKVRPNETINRKILTDVFHLFGERPQLFEKAIESSLGAFSPPTKNIEADLIKKANKYRDEVSEQMRSTYLGLDRIDQVTLFRVLNEGANLKPYDAKSLAFYSKEMGEKVSANQIQASIERLRNREDPILWKSMTGEYSVAETIMRDWYKELTEKQKWPPRDE
jgi:hypothetical protein